MKYELVVVLEVNRPEEQITASIEKIEEVITKHGATVESREIWGKRRLAYPINRRRDGHYTLLLFESEPEGPMLAELNRHLRISEDVLRFLITKAVVGKSRGNPPAEGQEFGGYRGGRRDDRGDRGDRRERYGAPRDAESRPPREQAPREAPQEAAPRQEQPREAEVSSETPAQS